MRRTRKQPFSFTMSDRKESLTLIERMGSDRMCGNGGTQIMASPGSARTRRQTVPFSGYDHVAGHFVLWPRRKGSMARTPRSRPNLRGAAAILRPLLFIGLLVGGSAVCVPQAHSRDGAPPAAELELATTTLPRAAGAPAVPPVGDVTVLSGPDSPLRDAHRHSAEHCESPLPVALRRAASAADPGTWSTLALAPPTDLSTRCPATWTAQPAEHAALAGLGNGRLLDLLCVSRT